MTAKLIVLYPRPTDVEAFEQRYHAHHMALMRRLVGPTIPLPTYLVAGRRATPFYRVAEICFPSADALRQFTHSPAAIEGLTSSRDVSSGGDPIYLSCIADEHTDT